MLAARIAELTTNTLRLLDCVLPSGGYVVVAAEAYFDESGSHNGSPVLCLAGYVFLAENAKNLTREWNAVLNFYQVPYFHMAEIASDPGHGPFRKLTKDQRIRLVKRMIKIANRYTAAGLAVTVVEDAYLRKVRPHENLKSPYNFCVNSILAGVSYWLEKTGFDGDVAYFFESGHESQPEANRVMDLMFKNPEARKESHYASHAFIDGKKSAPLQAADLLAWQWFTDQKRRLSGNMVRRKDCAALLSGGHYKAIHVDDARIDEIANAMFETLAYGYRAKYLHRANVLMERLRLTVSQIFHRFLPR